MKLTSMYASSLSGITRCLAKSKWRLLTHCLVPLTRSLTFSLANALTHSLTHSLAWPTAQTGYWHPKSGPWRGIVVWPWHERWLWQDAAMHRGKTLFYGTARERKSEAKPAQTNRSQSDSRITNVSQSYSTKSLQRNFDWLFRWTDLY